MRLERILKVLVFLGISVLAAAAPASAAPLSRRIATASESYEIVAVLKGGMLSIFVDRYADNAPVTGDQAQVSVAIDGGSETMAEPSPDGTFVLGAPALGQPGSHEIVFTVREGDTGDLLIAPLDVPDPLKGAGRTAAPAPLLHIEAAVIETLALLRQADRSAIAVAGSFAAALAAVLALWVHRRRSAGRPRSIPETRRLRADGLPRSAGRKAAAAAIVLVLSAAAAPAAFAHGGEDHGSAEPLRAETGDAPHRLPDASVFLPKSTQRLIEIRTVIAKTAMHKKRLSFAGRIIADPERSGVVQSTLGGRIVPAGKELPKLGQEVAAGEILGYVAPFIAAIDRSDAAQTAGDLDQRIALAETRLARAERLFAVNAGTRVQVEEARIELDGLRKRRSSLRASQTDPEALLAPVGGVISAVRAVAGQVAEPKDVLYEIIDPSSLWVEAFMFGDAAFQSAPEAFAVAGAGPPVILRFVGRSRSLRQQSVIAHFAIEPPPPPTLYAGAPVTVLVQSGEVSEGVLLPKAAVVRAENGEDIVWRHEEPERFAAVPVKASAFDGANVLVIRGIGAGSRIVIKGAGFLGQIR